MKFKKSMVFLTAASALVLAACGNGGNESEASEDGDSVRIGSMFELSGEVSAYGVVQNQALQLAQEEINADGGINGMEMELIEYDTNSDETEAASVATRLATQDNVHAIIGPAVSAATKASIPNANRAEVPLVSPSATDDTITVNEEGEVEPFGFRTAFPDSFQGEALAQFASEELGAENVAVLGDNSSDYALGVYNTFEEAFSGDIVTVENFTSGETDFSAVLTSIDQEDFDVLFVPGYYEQGGPIINQARSMGIDQPILAPDGFGNEALFELAGEENMNDVYYTSQFSLLNADERTQEFADKYEEQFGSEPDMFASLSYDTAYLVKDAVERAGSTDPLAIRDALEETNEFDGITGTFSIDENHNPVKSVTLVEVQDGEEVNAFEIDPAN